MSETKPRNTDVQKLQRAIVDGLEDVKGQDIVVFNTEHLSPLFERVIIASGTSNRQTKALASSVCEAVKDAGFPKPRIEGEGNGEWIIVDCGAAVAHVMQPNIRQYYHLEEIWGGKVVHLKLGSDKKKPVAEDEAQPAAKSPARKKATKAAAESDAADAPKAKPAKPAAKKAAATGQASAAKAPAAKKAAPRSTTAKPAAKKTAAGGTAAAAPVKIKTLVVGKPTAKKAAAGKTTAARKSPARKSSS
jgi:ribosome-associated protein